MYSCKVGFVIRMCPFKDFIQLIEKVCLEIIRTVSYTTMI